MAVLFPDEEFLKAWRELDEPQLGDGWEVFADAIGIQLYRYYCKDTGLYEYKVFGSLSSCSPEVCADVYTDLDYRKQWDSYLKELQEYDYDGQKAIYWEVKYPFPLSNRDYVFVWERRDLLVDGRQIYVVLAKSSVIPQCPVKAGVIRVTDYKQSTALVSDGNQGTKVFMNYFDNPGGNIPTSFVNWAAKNGVPSFLKNLQDGCDKFADYCKNRK